MTNHMLDNIEQNVDALIKRCQKLESEIVDLRKKEGAWAEERKKLIEKNEKARSRVETMINHLKKINPQTEQRTP